jgi:hypothetical protein
MINHFDNDSTYVLMNWMLKMLNEREVYPTHLLEIRHLTSSSSHLLAILPNDCYLCDCGMGTNLGVPCHHYWRAWMVFQ